MPIALILRIIARLALARALSNRGAPPRTPGTVGGGGGNPSATPAGAATRWVAARLGGAVDVARIVLHLIALAAFLGATGILFTAGTTLVTLGPRWVGIIFLVLAAVTALVSMQEMRVALRLRRAWRLRQNADRLRRAGGVS